MKKFLRTLLLLINLFFVALFIFSTLAVDVSPQKFIIFSFLSYGYLALLIINVLFALVWMFLKRWEFLISVIAIVLRMSIIPYYVQFGGNSNPNNVPPTNSPRLAVMSFNAYLFAGKDTARQDVKGNIQEFLGLLRQTNPDILCLQEYCNVHGVGDSLKRLGFKHLYSEKKPSGYIYPYGTVLYSKYPIVKIGDVPGSTKFYVDIKVQHDTVRTFCVHLDSYALTKGDYEELGNINQHTIKSTAYNLGGKFMRTIRHHEEEWDILSQAIQESPHPVIVAGDFNDTPASYICGQMRKMLNDSFKEQGTGFGATYHGLYPNYRIDFIYYSPSIKTIAYQRIKSDISDHYPIVAHFDILTDNDIHILP